MKRDFLRRSLALAVAVSMTVSSFPGAAFAEEAVYEEIVADDAVEVADMGTDEIVADDAAVVAEEVAEAEVAETPLEAEAPAEDASIEIETVEEVSADEVAELYAGTTPAKVTGVAVDEDNYLTWYADVAADGYEIKVTGADNKEYKDYGSYLYTTSLATSIGSYLTAEDGTGMTAGAYSVQVRAVNNYYDATTGEWQRLEGEWSDPVPYTIKAKEVKTPDAVSNVEVSEDGASVSWHSDENPDCFEISVTDTAANVEYKCGTVYDKWDSEAEVWLYSEIDFASADRWSRSFDLLYSGLHTFTQNSDGTYKPVTVPNAEGGKEYVTPAVGGTYTVRVRAVNKKFNSEENKTEKLASAWSDPVTCTIKATQKPSKMAAPVFDQKTQTLSWYNVADAGNVEMEIKDAAGRTYYEDYDWDYDQNDQKVYTYIYPQVSGLSGSLNVKNEWTVSNWNLYSINAETGQPELVRDEDGKVIVPFAAGETYTVRMRAYSYNNNSTSSSDWYLYGEWSEPVTVSVEKDETQDPAAVPDQVAGVWVNGQTLSWDAIEADFGYSPRYEIEVIDADKRAYHKDAYITEDKDGNKINTFVPWRTSGTAVSLSKYQGLKTYVTVDDRLVPDIHKKTGEEILAFEEGNTYSLRVRAIYERYDEKDNKVETAGEWSRTVTYSIPKEDIGINAAPAKVTGLTLKTEDMYYPMLQWNYVEGAARYEALITDAANHQYYAGYELEDDGTFKPIYKKINIWGDEYFPSCSVNYLTHEYIEDYDENVALKAYYKTAGVSVATAKDAAGEDLKLFAPGQSYSIQIRAVNTYSKWNAGKQSYDEAVETPGEWSDPVTYTTKAIAPITDLAYVEEDKDGYYFTYSAVIENSNVYYQIATDAQFTSSSLLGDENRWREAADKDTYKLCIEKDIEDVKFVPGTYYVRAVNSVTEPTKDEVAQMTIPVVSFTVTAEAAKVPKDLAGLKLYKETAGSFEFRFDAILEEENDDHFVLQYTDVTPAQENDWVSYIEDENILPKSVLHEGTNYVRVIAYVYDEESKEKYGKATDPVPVTITKATSAVGELQLVEKTQDGYVFKITGTPRKDEEVEFWYSESPEFTSDTEITSYDYDDNDYEVYFPSLTPGKTYYVRARVYNPKEEDTACYSAFSNVVTVKAEMARVRVVASSIASKSITLAMNKLNEDGQLTGYQIQKKVGKKYVTLVKTTNNTYKDSNLSANKTYTYRVRPYYYDSEAGTTTNGTWAYFQATTWGSALNLNATPKSKTSVKLTWKKVTGANGYEIYRKVADSDSTTISNDYGDGFEKYTLVKKLTKASKKSYTDKKLTSGLQYQYMVRAYKTVGKKKYYISESAYVDMSFGAAVNIKRVVNNADGSVKVYWTQVYAGDGYVVEQYDETTDKWVAVKTLKKSTGSTTLPAAAKTTQYRIRAYKVKGNEFSEPSWPIPVYPNLAAATGVKAVANAADGSITVSWNPVAGADHYLVFRTTSSWKEYDKTRKTYTYLFSDRTDLVNVYEADPTRVSGYKFVDEDDRTATTIVDRPITYTTVNGTTKVVEEGPVPGVKYYYFVMACAKGTAYNYKDKWNTEEEGTEKISGCSKAATATVTATSVKKPTLKSAKAGKKKVTLKWKKVTGADGYAIYRSTKKKSGYVKIAEVTKGTTVKYVDKTAKSKTRYYYKIRAIKYNEAGATTYSSYSKIKNAKAK